MQRNTSFAGKLFACLVLSFSLAGSILLIGTDSLLNTTFIFSSAALLFIIPLIILPIWEYQGGGGNTKWKNFSSTVYTIITYITGFCIGVFGWKKIFNLQFRLPLSIADLPMSSQNGETLTWYYFGYSHLFGLLIAFMQIAASFLLFFSKTRLAGILILLPVMINIFFINVFYNMNAGALFQSFIYTLSLIFLSFRYRQTISNVLFHNEHSGLIKRQRLPAMLIFICSFLLVFLNNLSIKKESSLFGSYEVAALSINGKEIALKERLASDSVLTRVYFDLNNVCVLEYNDPGKRLIAKYSFNDTGNKLTGIFTREREEYKLNATALKQKNMIKLEGSLGEVVLNAKLKKTDKR
jgi:hypothetical protein